MDGGTQGGGTAGEKGQVPMHAYWDMRFETAAAGLKSPTVYGGNV